MAKHENLFLADITSALKDAVLNCIWAKKQLMEVLTEVGCRLNIPLDNDSIKDKTKSQIFDDAILWMKENDDAGLASYRKLLQRIKEWRDFNSYWFEQGKLDSTKARQKIKYLAYLIETNDKREIEERERKKKSNKVAENGIEELKKLRDEFYLLSSGKDKNGRNIPNTERGILFEKFLINLFNIEKFQTTGGFKVVGEQIDFSFKHEGNHYIVEAKWHEKEVASNYLLGFNAKVEGKFYGRGLFISLSGFSSEAIEVLIRGRKLVTILMDGQDLIDVLNSLITLKDCVSKKIEAAQTKGWHYYDPISKKERLFS